MALVVIPNSTDNIEALDSILIGLEEYSVNVLPVEMNELKNIAKGKKDVFVALNKNFTNDELDSLTDTIKELSTLNIAGIFYYDVAVLNIVNKLNVDVKLIWASEHLTTNYETINYWHKHGVWGTFLSTEITLDEIIEIAKNTSATLFVQLFGYIPMYVSRRHAIKNYLRYFNLDDHSSNYTIFKEGKEYRILDNDAGTQIYSSFILNGLAEYLILRNTIPYIIVNGYGLDNNQLLKVIDLFNNLNSNNLEKSNLALRQMFDNLESGFLHEETIYQVKKNAN